MINSSKIERILFLLSVGVMFSLYFKENLNSLFLIAFSVVLIVQMLNRNQFPLQKEQLVISVPMIIYLLLAVVGSFVDNGSNLNYVVRLIPFAMTPLFIYYFSSIKIKLKLELVGSFIIGNLILLFVLDLLAIYDMVKNNSLFVELEGRNYYRFLYSRFTLDYFNHIYLGIYSMLSIVLLQQFKIFNKHIRLTFVLYLILHLIMLGSRAVVISALIGALVFLIYASFNRRKYLKYLVIFLSFLTISSTIVYAFRDTLLLNRYSQVFEWYNNWDIILERNYSVNNRIKLYIVGFSMFKDVSLYGINGSGSASSLIEEKYESHFQNKFNFNTNTYNTHNQYLNNFIDWGLLGLLITILLLTIAIKYSIENQLNWVTFFWLFFSIVLMMESVLIRHRGIVLFVVFFSFFLSLKKSDN